MNLDVILLVLQVFLALGIIALILLQKGKGAGEGAAFGGGGASTVFGASGSSNFLSKSTAILAVCFFINSLALAYLAGNRDDPTSVIDTIETPAESRVDTKREADAIGGDNVPPAVDEPVESDVPPAAD
ncbi:MAG: preprotein translocase subunit SecG [Gammaproteobacteria bacterium]|nr:preprotein translocase subunit SecG [Gammaproteobacteria bacterium]